MLDDDNAKEIEAALREDDDSDIDIEDGLTPEQREAVRAEALAEEEFIADREDTVNPLIFDKATKQPEDLEHEEVINLEARYGTVSGGVIGSGNLAVDMAENPISNEHELRKENVNEDNYPISDPTDAGAAPMGDDLANPVNDAPITDSGLGGNDMGADSAAEGVSNDGTENMMASEPINTEPTPAPSADMPQATEAPTPIPGGMPSTPVDATPAADPMMAGGVAPAPKKKKKTGLIIGIVLLVLVIVGVIGGVIFYNAHEAPAKQVSDAVMNTLTAPPIGATKASSLSAGEFGGLKMNISGSMAIIPTNSKEKKSFSLTAEIAMKDAETLYMKIGGVKEIMNDMLKEAGETSDEAEAEIMKKVVDSVVSGIDNTWIAISSKEISKDNKSDCLSESMDKMSSDSYRKKMEDIYNKHPFVKYKDGSTVESRDGLNYYTVEIDKDASKAFGNDLEATDEFKEFESCFEKTLSGAFNSISSAAEFSSKAALASQLEDDEDDGWLYALEDDDDDYDFDDDYDSDFDDDDFGTGSGSFGIDLFGSDDSNTTVTTKLGITSWSHELKGIELTSKDKDDNEVKLDMLANTYKDSDVSGAKSIETLMKDIEKSVKEAMQDYLKDYAKQMCKEYEDYLPQLGYKTLSECEKALMDEFEKEMGDMDLSTLFGGLGGSIRTSATVDNSTSINRYNLN